MYEKFDRALERALTEEITAFGAGERRLGLATARRAAAENRVKALNEASLGNLRFAAIHETASTRHHDDAEAMALGSTPSHHSLSSYLSMASSFQKADERIGVGTAHTVVPLRPATRRATAA